MMVIRRMTIMALRIIPMMRKCMKIMALRIIMMVSKRMTTMNSESS